MKQQLTIGLGAVAIALIVLGFCLKAGMDNFTFRDRTISARGVAEKEVVANKGNASTTVNLSSDDLVDLKNHLIYQSNELRKFAIAKGIADSCITVDVPNIYSNSRDYNGNPPEYAYSGACGITIYTTDVVTLDKYQNSLYQLIDNNILATGYAAFDYTELNDIKPSMISEATHNARIAAQQFAKDSGSRIGLIKSANQGYFSIDNIEGKPAYCKNVRVVTSVEFYLND